MATDTVTPLTCYTKTKHECAAQGVGNGPDGNSDFRFQSCPSGDWCPYVHWPPACNPRPYEGYNLCRHKRAKTPPPITRPGPRPVVIVGAPGQLASTSRGEDCPYHSLRGAARIN